MRLLVLAKRRYMGKDVIDDRYGRLYELPLELARRGHRVLGICTAYRRRGRGEFRHFDDGRGCLVWQAIDALPDLPRLGRLLAQQVESFRPDMILSGSDALQVVLGHRLARSTGLPHAVDLYDNFESFGLTRLPGLRPAYRRALRQAAAISCVSRPLAEKIARETGHSRVLTLESTIPSGLFVPRDRDEARRRLDLPREAPLIGTAGALHPNRGIGALYEAFLALADRRPDLHLVLAGPEDARAAVPAHPRIRYLGQLAHDRVSWLYNALDVAAVCMKSSAFGDFAFPQKTYEILACGTPLVAAAIPALAERLGNYPQCLYRPGDARDLADKLAAQLAAPQVPRLPIPTWADQARLMETHLTDCLHESA